MPIVIFIGYSIIKSMKESRNMRIVPEGKKKKNRQLIAVMLLAFAIILVFGLLIMTKCSGGKSNSTDETNGTKNASAEQETKEYVPDADSNI